MEEYRLSVVLSGHSSDVSLPDLYLYPCQTHADIISGSRRCTAGPRTCNNSVSRWDDQDVEADVEKSSKLRVNRVLP